MRKFVVGMLLTAAVAVGGLLAVPLLNSAASSIPAISAAPACPKAASPVTVGTIVVPTEPVAGFCQDQLVNAAHIINAARDQGIGTHTQAVGVMTAIGETGLHNLDYGDAAGPDSRGLFQQRDNGAWGTLADRMDPYTAARHFFEKLTSLDGWQTMTPTEAAHAVQVNADPGYYEQFWPEAQRIVAALTG